MKLQKYTKMHEMLFSEFEKEMNYTKFVISPANFYIFVRSRKEEIFHILLHTIDAIKVCQRRRYQLSRIFIFVP